MKIRDLPERIRLTQLAEEAVELAHAALKLARVIDGASPTPVSEDEARRKVLEECADVLVCIDAAIGPGPLLMDIAVEKRRRWEERLGGTYDGGHI